MSSFKKTMTNEQTQQMTDIYPRRFRIYFIFISHPIPLTKIILLLSKYLPFFWQILGEAAQPLASTQNMAHWVFRNSSNKKNPTRPPPLKSLSCDRKRRLLFRVHVLCQTKHRSNSTLNAVAPTPPPRPHPNIPVYFFCKNTIKHFR